MTELLTTEQIHSKYGLHRRKLRDLRDYGLLIGTRYGHGYSYRQEDLDEFFNKTRGFDLGNRTKIAAVAQLMKRNEKRH